MLCNPLAAPHFGLRWGSGLLPLVPEPRVARAGFSSPRVSLRGPHGCVLGRLDTGKRTRGLQVPFECVAPGRPTDGPTWRQPHLGLTHWSSTPGEGSWWMVLLLPNLLLLNSEQGCHGPCSLSLSSEHLATLQVARESARELPPSPDNAHIPPAHGAHPRPACQPKEHSCRGHHPPPDLGLSHSRKRKLLSFAV